MEADPRFAMIIPHLVDYLPPNNSLRFDEIYTLTMMMIIIYLFKSLMSQSSYRGARVSKHIYLSSICERNIEEKTFNTKMSIHSPKDIQHTKELS